MTKYFYTFSLIFLLILFQCRTAKPTAVVTQLTDFRFGDSTRSQTDTITQDKAYRVRGTIVTNTKEPYTNLILQVSKETNLGEQLLYKEYLPVGKDGKDTLNFDKSHTFNKPMTPGKSRLIIRLMINDSIELHKIYREVVIMSARPIAVIKKDSVSTVLPLTYVSKGVFYSDKNHIFQADQPTNFIIRLSREIPSSVKRFKVHYSFDQNVTILKPGDRIFETLEKDTTLLLRDLIFIVSKPCLGKVTVKVSLIDLDTGIEFDMKQYSRSCGESLPPDIVSLKEPDSQTSHSKPAAHISKQQTIKRKIIPISQKKTTHGRRPITKTRQPANASHKRNGSKNTLNHS